MKRYRRRYEKFYTGERIAGHCRLPKVGNLMGLSTYEFRRFFRRFAIKYQKRLFDFVLKFYWLSYQFTYGNENRLPSTSNSIQVDRAYGIFARKYVGIDNRVFTNDAIYQHIYTYAKEWYPDVTAFNPFKKKIKYPYRYMTLECLISVVNMKERTELLERGEKNRMTYTRFLDYVLNYINCYNDEIGYKKYNFAFSHRLICSVPLVIIQKQPNTYEERIL